MICGICKCHGYLAHFNVLTFLLKLTTKKNEQETNINETKLEWLKLFFFIIAKNGNNFCCCNFYSFCQSKGFLTSISILIFLLWTEHELSWLIGHCVFFIQFCQSLSIDIYLLWSELTSARGTSGGFSVCMSSDQEFAYLQRATHFGCHAMRGQLFVRPHAYTETSVSTAYWCHSILINQYQKTTNRFYFIFLSLSLFLCLCYDLLVKSKTKNKNRLEIPPKNLLPPPPPLPPPLHQHKYTPTTPKKNQKLASKPRPRKSDTFLHPPKPDPIIEPYK